jgi:hypothetical protein
MKETARQIYEASGMGESFSLIDFSRTQKQHIFDYLPSDTRDFRQ